jgi:L-lactate dehydrogenase complex protein LldG
MSTAGVAPVRQAEPSGPRPADGGAVRPGGGAARSAVLARIRQANGLALAGGDGPHVTPSYPPAGFRKHGARDPAGLLDLLAERLADYQATVCRCPPGELAAAIRQALATRAVRRVVVPPGLDLPLPDGVDAVTDTGLPAADLDGMDGVVTRAALAIAETGTLVLDGSPGQGRRAITLVPDFHLCVLFGGQVVELVPEAIARLQPERPLTLISGPSATSDIELNRVEGVHGPRTLAVIIVDPGS